MKSYSDSDIRVASSCALDRAELPQGESKEMHIKSREQKRAESTAEMT